MKERPILFSTPMVRAILEGRKTMTRRVVKPQSAILTDAMARSLNVRPPEKQNQPVIKCPYGQPGDRLYVKETFCQDPYSDGYIYRADVPEKDWKAFRWIPSIFTPKAAARIWLIIADIRVERVQDISEADAISEGINHHSMNHPGVEFKWLWEFINGPVSWEWNPYVWVVVFKRIEP